MNNTIAQGVALVKELAPLVKDAKVDVVVCPTATALSSVADAVKGTIKTIDKSAAGSINIQSRDLAETERFLQRSRNGRCGIIRGHGGNQNQIQIFLLYPYPVILYSDHSIAALSAESQSYISVVPAVLVRILQEIVNDAGHQ